MSLDCSTLNKDSDFKIVFSCCTMINIVLRIDSNCNDVIEIESKVIALRSFEKISSHVVIEANLVRKILKNLSINDDEIKFTSFEITHRTLIEIDQIIKHQSILIHLAASVLKDATIQICKKMKVEVFVIVINEKERQYFVINYKLLTNHIYLTDNKMLADHLLQNYENRITNFVLSRLANVCDKRDFFRFFSAILIKTLKNRTK